MSETNYFVGALLASVGGALSFYFYSVYKGRISGDQWWVPSFLRMNSDTCASVIDTRFGRHFGKPNAAIGPPFMFIYSILLILAGIDLISESVTFLMAAITLFVAVYLIYGLWRIRTHCRICYTIHFLNLVIFLLQMA